MKIHDLKKVIAGTLVVICFVFSSGLICSSTAQANGGQQLTPPPGDGCLGCSHYGDTRLGDGRDKMLNRQQEINREGSARFSGDGKRREFESLQDRRQDLGSKGYVKRLRSRLPQYQADWGYRDGLNRGQEDARAHRTSDPNHSSHYRKGTEIYREAFRLGYEKGYHP
jgi:hypothetical protein